MDFRLAPEDEAFRKEVKTFLDNEWEGLHYYEYGGTSTDVDRPGILEQVKTFQKKLHAKGWFTMHWPQPWGNPQPLGKQIVYREEMGYRGAPSNPNGGQFAFSIMAHGQDWQKEYFLPALAASEIHFCNGLSEPNAGTDLANVQTRAVREGDDYIITGQKIWNSQGHRANWGLFLVRTDQELPKHRGLSYFLIDMSSPGITLRPLYDMLGRRQWSEVFLDGVRVPAKNMIGDENRGWYAAMTTLNFERTGSGAAAERPAHLLGSLEHFIDEARDLTFNGKSVLDDPEVRNKLADLRIRIEIIRSLAYYVAWIQSRGGEAAVEGSVLNLQGTLMNQFHMQPAFAKIIRHHRLFNVEEERAFSHGSIGTRYVSTQGHGFGGGGGLWLMPRNIAQRGLGLPR